MSMKTPQWLKAIQEQYKGLISNSFMLTGNIGDYVYQTTYLKDYLVSWLLDKDRWGHFDLEDVYIYDINTQAVSATTGHAIRLMPTPEGNEINLLSKMNDRNGKNAFIFYYPEYTIPAGDYASQENKREIVALHSAINSSNFVNSANIAIFITESTTNIHPMFLGNNSRISLLNIELPDGEDRLDFIEWWYNHNPDAFEDTQIEVSLKVIANMTAGLQYISIEDILLEANNLGYIDSNMVLDKKKEIIQKEFGEVIEIFDTEGLSLSKFAGQEAIKAYFKEVVIDAMKNNDIDIVPKGIMLMGPPGTGKTFFAKCLAADSGISFVEFKMSKILGKWVGESEKAMEKALSVFRALAPVGVFMDEIDQSMSRGKGTGDDGGSRVNSNLFGMLLSEMSKPSNRGKILWFAATNYPDIVDEALKRPGRFDKKIPFFAPTKEERAAVFKMHLNSDENLKPAEDVDYERLAAETDGYTQAEIEAIAVKARELSHRKKVPLTQEIIDLALSYMLSNQNDKIREMEDIALRECNDREFIPKEYLKRQSELLSKSNPNNSFSSIDRGSSVKR